MSGCKGSCGCSSKTDSMVNMSRLVSLVDVGAASFATHPDEWRNHISIGLETVEIRFTDNYRMVLKKSRGLSLATYDRIVVEAGNSEFVGTVLKVCSKPVCKREHRTNNPYGNASGRILRKATEKDLVNWLKRRKLNQTLSPTSHDDQIRPPNLA